MTGSRTLVSQHGPGQTEFSAFWRFYDDGSGPGSGTAAGFPQRDGAHDRRRAPGPGRSRCADHRRADRGGRPEPAGARRHRGDRRDRRHRHARHDRHPPAHVADGHAGLRGRLDSHPVFRLVLPELGQEVPAAGRLRREPAVGHRVDRRRRDDHGGLVARAADDRPRRSRHRRPGGGARAVRPGLREHPAGLVGVEHDAGVPGLLRPAVRRQGRHARVRDRLRHPR